MPVVACSNCGTKNRVDPRHAAEQIAKCGKCGTPFDLNRTDASDDAKPLIVTDATFQSEVLELAGRRSPVRRQPVEAVVPGEAFTLRLVRALDPEAAGGGRLAAGLLDVPAVADAHRVRVAPEPLDDG